MGDRQANALVLEILVVQVEHELELVAAIGKVLHVYDEVRQRLE